MVMVECNIFAALFDKTSLFIILGSTCPKKKEATSGSTLFGSMTRFETNSSNLCRKILILTKTFIVDNKAL